MSHDNTIKVEFDCIEIVKQAWRLSFDNAGIIIGGALLYLVIVSSSGMVPGGSLIVTGPLTVGLYMAFLKIIRGQPTQFEDIFSGFKAFGVGLGAYLLVALIVMGGILLLIVPGVIWALRYAFVLNVVADGETNVSEALRTSKRLTQGNLGTIFIFHLLMGLVNVAGMMACCLGLIITIPVTIVAFNILYNKFLQAHGLIGTTPPQ